MLSRDQLLSIAKESMSERKAQPTREFGYLLHHGQRVAALSLTLCQRLNPTAPIDLEVLFAAALFHDVGKCIGSHAETGAKLATGLLQDTCSPDELAQIAFLINQHNKRNQPDLPLAAHILQDADVLDHFGTQNIWLCFFHSAHSERSPQDTLDYYHSEENKRYLESCRALLNLDIARDAYDQRLIFEQAFIKRFGDELVGRL